MVKPDYKDIFLKLSNPLSCGIIHESTGRRYQTVNGKRSNEMIFILESELLRDKPKIVSRCYYNENDSAWRGAIKSFLSNPDVFRHPHRKIVCLEENGMVTSRTIMFDLKIETFFKL